MTRRSLLLPAAIVSVLGAMTALTQVYARQSWFGSAFLAVLVAFGAGWVARRLDVPGILAPAVSLLALVAFLGIVFHPSTTLAGLPTSATMRAIGESLSLSMRDIQALAAPAYPTAALRLLTTTGVFLVATLVDIMVFRLRRPVAAGTPLLALYLVPTSMTNHGNAFAFVLAAVGYLALLVAEGRDRARSWGRRLTGIDVVDDAADVSHVARVGRRIGTAAVGLALCVPLALPSVGEGIVGNGGGGWFGGGGGSNTATTINPIVEIQTRLRDNPRTELLTYRTDVRPDYLRLTPLNDFDGRQWNLVSQTSSDGGNRVGEKHTIRAPRELAGVALVEGRYDVKVGSLAVRWLPLPYAPSVVDVQGDWWYEPTGLAVFSATKTSHNVEFSVVSERPDPTVEQLRAPGTIPDRISETFLTVPDQTPAIALQALATAVKGATNPYDKALALQRYFRTTGGFTYDLDVPPGNGDDALTTFLTEKRGYCEQFAATMAYLARLADIPARVVVGFTTGRPLPDGSYVVTNSDAHAWPELYFPNVGWVRFEPTPRSDSISTPGYSVEGTAPGPGPGGPPEPPPTQQPPTDLTRDPSKGGNEANENLDDGTATPPAPAPAAKPFRVPVVPLALALALVVLVTPSVVAFGTRRRRSRAAGDAARIHAAWDSLADAAEDAGTGLRAADSPRSAARRLVAEVPLTGSAAAAAADLARAEERARYARVAPSAAEAAGLDDAVRLVRRALLAARPRRARVQAMVFPASAVRRILEAASRSSAAVERRRIAWVTRVAALFRRRRARTA